MYELCMVYGSLCWIWYDFLLLEYDFSGFFFTIKLRWCLATDIGECNAALQHPAMWNCVQFWGQRLVSARPETGTIDAIHGQDLWFRDI